MGQKISLRGNTNIAVNARLDKAKGDWGVIKKRIFFGKEIKTKIKLDLRNAAIMSIMKYGISTIATQTADGEMQSFASKCIRRIVVGGNNEDDYNKINNYTLRK